MAVLGPLENNVRIVFTISFRVPAQYRKEDGDAIIIDTLPQGLFLYSGSDKLSSVSINNIVLTSGFEFGGASTAICTISSTVLSANSNILITLDTYIANKSLITENTDIVNSSVMSFKNAADNKYQSTVGSVNYQLTGIDDFRLDSPEEIYYGEGEESLNYMFTAPDSDDETTFYYIKIDLGNNFDFIFTDVVPMVYAYYGYFIPIETINVQPCEPNHQFYTLKIRHSKLYKNQDINIFLDVKTKNLEPDTRITIKGALSIGSTIGIKKTFNISVYSF